MSRPLWFFAGAGVGVYAAARARRAAEALTADGLRDRVRSLGLGARMFAEEVAQGRADRAEELRARLGLAPERELGSVQDSGLDTLPVGRQATDEQQQEEDGH